MEYMLKDTLVTRGSAHQHENRNADEGSIPYEVSWSTLIMSESMWKIISANALGSLRSRIVIYVIG